MTALKIVWFVVVTGVIWTGVSFLLSWMSGWWVLAGVYRARFQSEGKSIKRQSAYTRWLGFYGHCLTFTQVAEGIQIEPHFPFWIGHPTLEVPWNDIRVNRKTSSFVELRFRSADKIPFRISKTLYDTLHSSRHDE